ncbi:MAG: porin [Bacteroidaceae bacterium]|nr:porin [Bacteroidaceae bacterium]
MNTFIKTTLAVSLAIFSSTAAMGQSEPLSTDGTSATITKNGRIELKELTEKKWFQELQSRIKLHGYAQAGYTYSHQGGQDKNTFDLKRVLFWAEAKITDRWSFLFMHDFSSVVQEYYTDYRFTKNKALTVRFGQFKNGLSLENPLSPTAMEAIDVYSEAVTFLTGCGSDPLLGVQYGRDLGLSLFGETNNGKFRYEVDVMNGQGINKKDGNNFKDIIARLEVRPVLGLNIVTTGQFGRGHAINTSLYNPTIAIGQDYKRHRATIGADYKSKAFNVHGEYLNGWDKDVHSWGAYITGAVPLARFGAPELGKRLELVASYDFFNFNTTLGMDQHKAIGGLQYWFYKKCRVQVQYVYKNAYIAENQFVHGANHGIQCQVQVRFN